MLVLDPPEVILRKFKRAVTDSGTEVRYDPGDQARRGQPAVDPGRRHRHHARRPPPRASPSTAPLKAATGEAVVELLRPVQERYAELAADPGRGGPAARHRRRQGPATWRPRRSNGPSDNIGLLPPG